MNDIFLCATFDEVTAENLVAVFRRQGWTVWRDESHYGVSSVEWREHSKVFVVIRAPLERTEHGPIARFGRGRVFLDMENIGRGADFVEAITGAAESCAVMVALISRQWVRSKDDARGEDEDYVRLEVAAALARKIPLIPITIQGASMPRAKELPDDLAPIARRNAFEIRDTRWERDVEDLILDLEKVLNG